MRRIFQSLLLAAVTLAGIRAGVAAPNEPRVKGSSSYINISTLFVDSESGVMSTTNNLLRPGAFFDFYTEDGLLTHYNGMGAVQQDTNYPTGTFYVYRMGVDLMDGEAMGYSNMGDGVFFHPTVPIAASQTPELNWIQTGISSANRLTVTSINQLADRIDRPSIALGAQLTAFLISRNGFSVSAKYLDGNTLQGIQSYHFGTGDVSALALVGWGEQFAVPNSAKVLLSTAIPLGPLQVSFAPDASTTSTVQIYGTTNGQFELSLVFLPVSGPSATEYLDQIGYTPTAPPNWILNMALRDKLSGKTKWLYPPLDRYADVNGDGAIDAADWVALIQLESARKK